jgi:hypothetical protein
LPLARAGQVFTCCAAAVAVAFFPRPDADSGHCACPWCAGKRPGWHDGGGEVAIHPSSICHPLEAQQYQRPYLMFLEKVVHGTAVSAPPLRHLCGLLRLPAPGSCCTALTMALSSPVLHTAPPRRSAPAAPSSETAPPPAPPPSCCLGARWRWRTTAATCRWTAGCASGGQGRGLVQGQHNAGATAVRFLQVQAQVQSCRGTQHS